MLANRKKLLGILTLALVFAMLVCTMGITVFADDATAEATGLKAWWDSYNQIVGYCVAGVIFVVMVIVVWLWIPKENDKKKSAKRSR